VAGSTVLNLVMFGLSLIAYLAWTGVWIAVVLGLAGIALQRRDL
jgi:hypothetical protein